MRPLLGLLGGLAPAFVAWALGRALLRRPDAPHAVALAVGAVAESFVVFLLLALGVANVWTVVGLVAVAAAIAALRRDWPVLTRAGAAQAGTPALLYLVYALTPEIQPDGVTYHLGLVSEYARLGGFTDRIDFYSVLPQGMEMLFFVAYVLGQQAAAKVTSLVFLAATVPLLFSIGRKLAIPDYAAGCAAALYVCAPIVGLTGSSSYTDTALVFFVLSAFWFLLDGALFWAGLTAGLCYAIKISGGLIPVAVVVCALARRRWWPALAATLGAALVITPWLARTFLLTGSPTAPLLNRIFPNAHFHLLMEQTLSATWRTYEAFSWARAPWDLAVTGRLHGLFGPLFLLAPIGLVALRTQAGRRLWGAALVAGLPWLFNVGARFLMPAVPFLAMALTLSLPRRLALAAAGAQFVACLPPVVSLYADTHAWRLREFPWRAALGLESDRDYLGRHLWGWQVADMMNESLPPGTRVFMLMDAPRAHSHAALTDWWQSGLAERLVDTLRVASVYSTAPLFEARAEWPEETLLGLRYRLRQPHAGEWCVHEVRVMLGDHLIHASPQWRLNAWPNPWETPSGLDDNLASRWRTWEPMRPGMFFEALFDRPQRVTSATLLSHTPLYRAPIELYTRGLDGTWRLRSGALPASPRAPENLRRAAMRFVKSHGFDYLVAPTEFEGAFNVGQDLKARPAEWGIEKLNERGFVTLYKIP